MTDIITALFLLLGAAFILMASIGLIRFKDLLSRMHASTKATSFGILLVLIGVGLFFNTGIIWLKAFLVAVFVYLTAPLAAHSIAKSFGDNEKEKW